MWIFGYGSLVWKSDFPYVKKIIGYIKGYERKFWQASVDHRGVIGKPGRVVTLIPSTDPEAVVWGAAYQIHPRDVTDVIIQLDIRENKGYKKVPVEFYPAANHPMNLLDAVPVSSTSLNSNQGSNQNGSHHEGRQNGVSDHRMNSNGELENGHSNGLSHPGRDSEGDNQDEEELDDILGGRKKGHILVTMYYGNSENPHFLGPASMEDMVAQIYSSSGASGSNKEYLYNLADAMRTISEEAVDPHLAEIEMRVRQLEMTLTKRRSGRSTPIEL